MFIKNIETEEEASMPAAISQKDWNRINVNISVSDYIKIDDDIATTGILTDINGYNKDDIDISINIIYFRT